METGRGLSHEIVRQPLKLHPGLNCAWATNVPELIILPGHPQTVAEFNKAWS